MAEGMRLVSVRRGVDPRRFALLAFGGAAGLHVTDVARQLDLERVIVPRRRGGAVGLGHARHRPALRGGADAHRRRQRARRRRASGTFREMEAEGMRRLRASFAGPARASRAADMRYGEQVFEITVPLDDIDWMRADPLPQIAERFHRRHEALYTYRCRTRKRAGQRARHRVGHSRGVAARAEPAGLRRPPRRGASAASIWTVDGGAGLRLRCARAGQAIAGPAIIELAMTTVLLRPGDAATVTAQGWLDIAIRSE